MLQKNIYGLKKTCFDSWLFIRIILRAIVYFGFFKSFREIKKYYSSDLNLFKSGQNRYIKTVTGIYSIPDLPSMKSKQFISYIIDDIEYINHGKKPPPVFAILCITAKCPYKCTYCYNSHQHKNHELISEETLIGSVKDLIDSGINQIYLSGGEPLMRWDSIIHILNEFQESGARFFLLTTGWNLSSDKITELKRKGLTGIMLSLDTNDDNSLILIKNEPDYSLRAQTVIKNALDEGLLVSIDMVLTSQSVQPETFMKYIDFVKNSGVHFVNCYFPKPSKNNKIEEDNKISTKEFEEFGKLLKKLSKEKKFQNHPIFYSPDIWESSRGCSGGKLFIYIDPEGNIHPCPFIDFSYGNISNKRTSDIMETIINDKTIFSCPNNLK